MPKPSKPISKNKPITGRSVSSQSVQAHSVHPGFSPAPAFLFITPFRVIGDVVDEASIIQTINEYFTYCQNTQHFPTMTGLALCLGVTRKDLLKAISKTPELQLAIDRAKQKIVEYVEQLLLSGRPPVGLMFWLKNNDSWIDVKELKHSDKSIGEILDDLDNTEINEGEVIPDSLPPAALPSTSPLLENIA